MDSIQLKDFIRNTLVQIASGITEANEALKNPDKNQFEVFTLRSNRGDSLTTSLDSPANRHLVAPRWRVRRRARSEVPPLSASVRGQKARGE